MTGVNQRHHIVLLFTDLTDSTRLGSEMEPEQYADLLQQLRALIGEIIPRHGGEIARIDGDGALCIFGYPLAHEDAGRRATEAALDLHAATAMLDPAFAGSAHKMRMHSGIHAGIVLLRSGDMVRGRFEMLGNATNVAARLCDAAGEDDILVSEETLGSDRHFFCTGPCRRVRVQGQETPLAAYAVMGRRDVATRFAAREHAGLTPFVGREAELDQLSRWLEPESDFGMGQPTGIPVMLLHGDAGIGKSRLTAEFATRAANEGWRILRGYCEAYLIARPLQPFLQVAGALDVAGLPRSTDDVASYLTPLIAAAALEGPLLIIIDDWQWADDASRELLSALAAGGGTASRNVRILLASRRSDLGVHIEGPLTKIGLAPLAGQAMASAIVALLPASDPFAQTQIEEASGGSPLLIEELCHAWQAGRSSISSRYPRGAWFDLAVQARLALLAPDDAALLQAAAVIGHMIPTWLLAATQGRAVDAAALERLQAADFLFRTDAADILRFKHGLTREAVYAIIGLNERRALHARILAILEEQASREGVEPWLDALAYHSSGAELRDLAISYAIRAGDAALAADAPDRAQAHYRAAFGRALTLPDGQERQDAVWALLNKFGLACIVDPSADQLSLLEDARNLLVEGGCLDGDIRGLYWMGAITYGLGQGRRSVELLQEALSLAKLHGRTRFLQQIQTKLAQSLFAAGQYAEADRLFQETLPMIRSLGGRNDRDAVIYALCCHGFLLADQGRFAEALRLYAEADALQQDRQSSLLASCLTQKAAIALWRGEWLEAQSLAESCLQNSRKVRTRFQAVMSQALRAYAEWQLTHDEAAVRELEAAAAWFLAGSNSQQRTSLVHGWLVDVLAQREDRSSARLHAQSVVQRIRRGGDRLGEASTWRALALLEEKQGRPDRADHYCHMAQRSASIRRSPREAAQTRLYQARLEFDRGRPEVACAHARGAGQAFAAMDMPGFVSEADTIIANC